MNIMLKINRNVATVTETVFPFNVDDTMEKDPIILSIKSIMIYRCSQQWVASLI